MSPTYHSWRGMIERCKPEGDYGRRGITVCDRWRIFANFLEDMGERPEGKEIDRKNNDGNYEPSNGQWLEVRPNRQKRRSVILTPEMRLRIRELRAQGVVYRVIAEELGVSKSCVAEFTRGAAWDD
jgi:hypothetical protein